MITEFLHSLTTDPCCSFEWSFPNNVRATFMHLAVFVHFGSLSFIWKDKETHSTPAVFQSSFVKKLIWVYSGIVNFMGNATVGLEWPDLSVALSTLVQYHEDRVTFFSP